MDVSTSTRGVPHCPCVRFLRVAPLPSHVPPATPHVQAKEEVLSVTLHGCCEGVLAFAATSHHGYLTLVRDEECVGSCVRMPFPPPSLLPRGCPRPVPYFHTPHLPPAHAARPPPSLPLQGPGWLRPLYAACGVHLGTTGAVRSTHGGCCGGSHHHWGAGGELWRHARGPHRPATSLATLAAVCTLPLPLL
jgi:hypothetical protein